MSHQNGLSIAVGLASVACLPVIAQADIVGFNNLTGWKYNQASFDPGTIADLPDPNTLHLTNLGTSQARSVFYTTRQNITQFTASFTYRTQNAGIFCGYGASFTLHNSPTGASAVGSTGGGLGYGGISNSAAIGFYLNNNSAGFFTGGSTGSTNPLDMIDLRSGHDIDVTLSYSGSILTQRLVDTVTGATSVRNLLVGDLSSYVGDDLAYVGFTASTTTGQCSGTAANQYFSNFRFTTVPSPAAMTVMTMGGLAAARRRRSRVAS